MSNLEDRLFSLVLFTVLVSIYYLAIPIGLFGVLFIGWTVVSDIIAGGHWYLYLFGFWIGVMFLTLFTSLGMVWKWVMEDMHFLNPKKFFS